MIQRVSVFQEKAAMDYRDHQPIDSSTNQPSTGRKTDGQINLLSTDELLFGRGG